MKAQRLFVERKRAIAARHPVGSHVVAFHPASHVEARCVYCGAVVDWPELRRSCPARVPS